jgi:hypothetical protein
MKNYQKNPQWLRDVRSRQRNVVFPDTVQNEARFWRNLGTQQWSISTTVGLGLLSLFVFGSLGAIFYALFNEGEAWSATWKIVLAMVFFGGPNPCCACLGDSSGSPESTSDKKAKTLRS